jgi:ankyrin repeat protein
MAPLKAYAMVAETGGKAPARRYLVLERGELRLHQNVRVQQAGKPPISLTSLAGSKCSRSADVLELKVASSESSEGPKTLMLHFESAALGAEWEEALVSAAAQAQVESESERKTFRHSTMEVALEFDLKAARRQRAASRETFSRADSMRSDDEKSLLQMLLDAAARGDEPEEIAELVQNLEGDADGVDATGRTALMMAAAHGHAEVVAQLLQCGASIDQKNFAGASATMIAAERGHAEVLRNLLEAGARINGGEVGGGETEMHLAVKKGHLSCVEELLSARRDRPTMIDLERRYHGMGALKLATISGHGKIAHRLMEAGAICDVHSAAALGIEHVIERAQARECDAQDMYGRTTLYLAAREGHEALVEGLLGKGASLTLLDVREGNALQAASDRGHAAVVSKLLGAAAASASAGAEGAEGGAAHQNEDGETALLHASKRGHVAVVKILLKDPSGASTINVCDGHGASPLLFAVAGGHVQSTLELLAAPGVNVDAADRFGCTALGVAAAAGNSSLVATLLAAGADPDKADNARETPLMAAALHGSVEATNAMLGHLNKAGKLDMDLDAANDDGETALMLAIGEHREQVAKALTKAGAKVDAVDVTGRSALMRAVAQAYEEPARRRSLGAAYGVAAAPKTKKAESPKGANTATQWLDESLKLIQLLADSGASLKLKDDEGADALSLAAGAPTVVKFLRGRLGTEGDKVGAADAKKANGGKNGKGAATKDGAGATVGSIDIEVENDKRPGGGGCCVLQ